MINNSNKVKCPRWHYRNVQQEVKNILDRAKEGGDLKAAMVAYINERQERLPVGVTAETAVDSILKTVDGFTVAHEEGRTSEDIKLLLQESVAEMDQPKALAFLAVLEATFRSCDVNATAENKIDEDKLIEAIKKAVETGEGDDVASRIDRLAEMILGDSLSAYVFAEGNSDVQYLIQNQEKAEEIDRKTASLIYEAILAKREKAESYAATACACYGMVLDGKVKGVSSTNIDAGVMTALVVGGLEKASILTRLARGEIDAEVAKALLDGLVRALKWILVKAIQATFIVGVMWAVGGLVSSSAWMMAAGGVFLTIGLLVGVGAALELEENFEAAVDFLGKMVESAAKRVCNAVVWVWNRCADAVRSIGSGVPASIVPA